MQNLHKRISALEPVIVDKKDDKKDEKSALVVVPRLLGKGNTSGTRNFRAAFMGSINTISSIGTANGTVITLTPGTSSTFSSYAGIYDDWRTLRIDVWVKVMATTTNSTSGSLTGTGNAPGNAIVVYDPVDVTSLSSVGAGMNYQQSTGLWSVVAPGNGYPAAYTRNGFQMFHIKIPAPVVDPGILTDLLDSNWVSTKDTGVIVGYLKPYVDVLGAATYSVVCYFYRYHCEFRSRT